MLSDLHPTDGMSFTSPQKGNGAVRRWRADFAHLESRILIEIEGGWSGW